ncbi:hypothetical protein JANAI62_20210 [Jannaschia pagri]|uniref:Alginate biosynthesis protein AlgF n=1 Tax=Jannaschia pagri TaxID=2829797 RepID=A0ABQ4NLV6_9RHOB|nr:MULTISPECIES: alginate O-acetyltransferase AlgF [unclassified Jannaschia]GIT91564.1 hypothetical protein JANAI61_20220 [Jannaschia sp. AI_61]GIT95398.1 hypothetical protein JANAI62_20210 [Jannaschia sp. AI_62]
MFHRRTFLASAASAVALLLVGPAAWANDDGLYEDVFDPQSSFIRVLSPEPSVVTVAGTRLTEMPGGLSAYVNVMPGAVPVTTASGATELEVAPSTHYTVVLQRDAAPVVLVDSLTLSPAKSDVSLYNLSGQGDVDLFVPAARAVALNAVPVSGSKSVALKAPLTLDFDFRAGDRVLASIPAVELKRRAGVSVVLTEADGSFSAVAVTNSYLR